MNIGLPVIVQLRNVLEVLSSLFFVNVLCFVDSTFRDCNVFKVGKVVSCILVTKTSADCCIKCSLLFVLGLL